MSIYITSDLHLGHTNIIHHCDRPFKTSDEMDWVLINNLNNTVGVRDKLYILGDFTFYGKESAIKEYLKYIDCKKVYLIKGNHDRNYEDKNLYSRFYNYLELKENKKLYCMFHYPITEWNNKWHGSIHLHGHQHNKSDYNWKNRAENLKRFDVGVDANNYKPVDLEYIRDFFE